MICTKSIQKHLEPPETARLKGLPEVVSEGRSGERSPAILLLEDK